MTMPFESTRSSHSVDNGACAVFGLIAAASALLSAVLILGPVADRKELLIAGGTNRVVASRSTASAAVRVASTVGPTSR